MKITISQDSDCCSDTDLGNSLEIEALDGGGGMYIAISGRFAMNDAQEIDQLADTLKQILKLADNQPQDAA